MTVKYFQLILSVPGAPQPRGQPGRDSERTEASRAAAAAQGGRAGREGAHLAAAGAQHHDGSAATKHG